MQVGTHSRLTAYLSFTQANQDKPWTIRVLHVVPRVVCDLPNKLEDPRGSGTEWNLPSHKQHKDRWAGSLLGSLQQASGRQRRQCVDRQVLSWCQRFILQQNEPPSHYSLLLIARVLGFSWGQLIYSVSMRGFTYQHHSSQASTGLSFVCLVAWGF